MITLALDSATDRCSVAASDGTRSAERHVDGSRQHAGNIVRLVEEVLGDVGASAHDVGRIVLADGPGSVTGLRVSASVAKALAWRRRVEWSVAPSLLARAVPHAPAGGGVVVALADALRGELYAGCWSIAPELIASRAGFPRTVRPDDLAALGSVEVVVGTVPDALRGAVEEATGRALIDGERALPDARQLIALSRVAGGTVLIDDIDAWEPAYGRPAEAQAVWERKHGRALPASTSSTR